MTVKEFYDKLSEMYPDDISASWDNDGIMVSGNTDKEVKRVLVALDCTIDVIRYAAEHGFDTVLTHHPMIFKGQKSIVPDKYCSNRIIEALKYDVSVISLHTRLDAGKGGVNDTLLKTLGYEVSDTFGDEDMPDIGRIAEIDPISVSDFAELLRETLGCEMIRFTGNHGKLIKKLAICGGAGGDFVSAVVAKNCDAYLTGECGYNKAQDAVEEGLMTFEIGHYHSESPVCGVLVFLAESIAGAETEFYDSCAYSMI